METVSTYMQIGEWEFTYCVDIEIVESIDTLTDTCTITIPRKVQWEGKTIALGSDPVFKRKDKVIVQAGYNGKLKTRFIGYIRNIKPGVPVTIECEDSMMLLKDTPPLKGAYKAVTLQTLLSDIIPSSVKFVCNEGVSLGDYRFTNVTPARILEDLRNRYGLFSYFRNINDEPVLYVGLAYWTDNRKQHTFTFGEDIINPDELDYKSEEDVRLRVKAVGIRPDNSKVEVEVGDPDGELRTVHQRNISLEALKIFAEAELKRFRYTGYRGGMRVHGEPAVRKGDIVNLVGNKYYPDTRHLVPKVTTQIGFSIGYKQIIEPRELITINE